MVKSAGYLGDFTVSFEDLDKDGENGTILQRIPITDEVSLFYCVFYL